MDRDTGATAKISRKGAKRGSRQEVAPPAPPEIEETESHAGEIPPHAELDALIGKFNGMKTMTIDAGAARRLLATNTGNRHVSQRRVNQLAAQMRDGHFENTGEAIIVSDEGILNNGQHRLFAVIDSDAVVEMDVRFGIPRRVFIKTDTGAGRGPADVLSIRGVQNANQISTALRLLLAYERGLPEHLRDQITNDEISRAFDRWPEIVEAAAKIQIYRFPSQIRSTPLYATTFLAMRAPRSSGLGDWLHVLATGLEAQKEHPAYQLRERLLRNVGAELGTRERQLLRFALMIKSWNLFRQEETVSMREFRWSATGRDPEPFPRVTGARLG